MEQVQWDPGPARPALAAGTVDVWRADLDGDPAAERTLSPAERARAARFARPGDGERWASAHAILRTLLGAYLGADPAALRFAAGAHGKPRLAAGEQTAPTAPGEPTAPGLRFNLSHSGGTALIAVAPDREVGVDVELPRRAVDHVAIARRILGEAEARRLAALDLPERERAFLRAWVRWEAALKCRGVGIGGGEAAAGGAPLAGEPPWLCDLDLDGPGAAALAVDGGSATVRRFRWPVAAP